MTKVPSLIIRPMTGTDATQVLKIYEMGIKTGNATFETRVPSWKKWNDGHLGHSRFVSETNKIVTGWVALSPVSKREAYRGVAEISIYIHKDFTGKGIGSALMERVINSSEDNGIWTLVAIVFPENEPSVRLHQKYGFREIGYREKISKIRGVWRNTVMFERRSRKTG
jgi:L-amino acid N-acyltransferase YncA